MNAHTCSQSCRGGSANGQSRGTMHVCVGSHKTWFNKADLDGIPKTHSIPLILANGSAGEHAPSGNTLWTH